MLKKLPSISDLKAGSTKPRDFTEADLPYINPKQSKFVDEWLIDRNASAAAIRAGYSVNTAGQIGCMLLKDPDVSVHVQWHLAQVAKRYEITRDKVFREIAAIAFSNLDDFVTATPEGDAVFDYSKTDRLQRGVLSELTVEKGTGGRKTKFKLHDKIKALGDLVRFYGYDAPQRVEISGPGGGPVATINADMTPAQAAELYAKTRDENG